MNMQNQDKVVIVAGARTAVGKFGGSLKEYEASDLGAFAIKAALERAKVDPADVDDVVMGCVASAAENAFMARLCSVKAGIPYEAGAVTVNRLCSSGLQAIVTGAMEIECGFANVVVAGGGESMDNIPFYLRKARFGYRMGHGELEDGLDVVSDDLEDVEDTVYGEDEDDESFDDEYYEDDADEDEDCYATTCPTCEETIYFDESVLDDGQVICPNCGEKLEIDLSSLDEEPEDNGDDQE